MVTQKKHKSYKKNQHDSVPQQQSKQFRCTTPREFEDLSTLFSWVVFKNTAIEAETKRNRMANETSAINTPPAPNQETQVPSKPSTNPNPTQPTEVIPRELEGTAANSPKQSFLPYLHFGKLYLTRNEKPWQLSVKIIA